MRHTAQTETAIRAAAERYIASQKSDPFCRGRVELHMRKAISGGYTQQGEPAWYDAVESTETRYTATGEAYQATVYRNIVRP